MIQRCDGACLALEALGELRGGNFDGDVAIESRIGGAIHLTHAPSSERAENFTGTEFLARSKWHSYVGLWVLRAPGGACRATGHRLILLRMQRVRRIDQPVNSQRRRAINRHHPLTL